MVDRNEAVIREFRANGGRVASFATQPLLLLTHRGARTGVERTNPLAYFRDDDRYVIVASKGGSPEHPGWYRNIERDPQVELQVLEDVFTATARTVEGEERERLWRLANDVWPHYAEYQEKTDREIPVVVLERR